MSMREAFRQAGIDVPDQTERRDEMARPRDQQGGPREGGRRDDGRGRRQRRRRRGWPSE